MSREKITAQNHEAWSNKYDGLPINWRVAKFTHWAMSHLYNVNLGFEDGAEEEIRSLPATTSLLMVGAHTSNHDSDAFAAAVEQRDFLRDRLTAKTHPMGKPGLLNSFLGRYFDAMGTFPGIREVDVARINGSTLLDADQKAEQSAAANAGITIGANHLIAGENVLNYGEGTRNRVDVLEIQPLKRGPARMACQAYAAGAEVAVVPFVIHYNNGHDNIRAWQLRKARNAFAQFGTPILVNHDLLGDTSFDREPPTYEQQTYVTSLIYDGLRTCLDGAILAAQTARTAPFCD